MLSWCRLTALDLSGNYLETRFWPEEWRSRFVQQDVAELHKHTDALSVLVERQIGALVSVSKPVRFQFDGSSPH